MRINDQFVLQTLYAKDMSLFRKDLARAVLIDNSLFSFTLQPDNGIPIADWRGAIAPAGHASVPFQAGAGTDPAGIQAGSGVPTDPPSPQKNEEEDPAKEERRRFGDFHAVKQVLEEIEFAEDVKPILRSKFRLVDKIIRKCISGMMLSSRRS